MSRRIAIAWVAFIGAVVWNGAARAQFGRGGDWTTAGGDAQRSNWVRADAKISKDTVAKFQQVWNLKLNNEPRQLSSLTSPSLLDRYIGYRGFRSLAFVGGSSDVVFGIDTDLARMEWRKKLTSAAAAQQGTIPCPGGMTANVTRPTATAMAAGFAGRGGGRGGAAKSGVGEPHQGAVTLASIAARPAAPPKPPPSGAPGRGPAGFGRSISLVYALSSDGMLHSLYVSNGEASAPPAAFLPASANAHGLIVADNVAYVATTGGCGGVANGVWALDLTTKQVTSWKTNGGGGAGLFGPAMGPDGTLYFAIEDGGGAAGSYSASVVALEAKTLRLKDWYTAGKPGFAATPVLFDWKGKLVLAAMGADASIHLLDASNLGGADHRKPLYKSNGSGAVPHSSGLASWQDEGGRRWLLASANNAVAAWKVVERDGGPALEAGWVSRELVSPLAPAVVNGVVFVVSSGEAAAVVGTRRSGKAVVYALDGATGKELWSSGAAIGSFVHGGALSVGNSQVYLGTHDGTLYAFGFPMEH